MAIPVDVMPDKYKMTLAQFIFSQGQHDHSWMGLDTAAAQRGKSRQTLGGEIAWLVKQEFLVRNPTTHQSETSVNWDNPWMQKILAVDLDKRTRRGDGGDSPEHVVP